jgi:hypothetical protein
MRREKTAEFSVIKQQELQTHRAGLVTPTRESHFGEKNTETTQSWHKWSCKLYLKGKVLLIPDNTEF